MSKISFTCCSTDRHSNVPILSSSNKETGEDIHTNHPIEIHTEIFIDDGLNLDVGDIYTV